MTRYSSGAQWDPSSGRDLTGSHGCSESEPLTYFGVGMTHLSFACRAKLSKISENSFTGGAIEAHLQSECPQVYGKFHAVQGKNLTCESTSGLVTYTTPRRKNQ